MSFVKAPGGQGFKMMLASWKRAHTILQLQMSVDPNTPMLVGRGMPERHPVTRVFTGYKNIEVKISDFLATGLPMLGARGGSLIAFNDAIQVHLDAIAAKFKTEVGVKAGDIIEVPIIYFPNDRSPTLADALTGGMVNTLVLGTTCVMAKAFGPESSAGDMFESHVATQLGTIGATAKFVDDWYPYHVALGEVHCGTNTLRDPGFKKWWEFQP